MGDPPPTRRRSSRLARLLTTLGPGIFIIGYVVGTGSVTSMAKAGAEYGMTLSWALALSCACTCVLLVAVSRVTILSGQTLMHAIRRQFGAPLALFLIAGLMTTVVASVIGVMGIAADVVRVWSGRWWAGHAVPPVTTALVLTGMLYFLFWRGSHEFFLRVMALIVAVMGVSFLATMWLVVPGPVDLVRSLQPALPSHSQAHLALAAMVGTTMASVCVVARSYLVAESGWGPDDLRRETRDAIVSMTLTFLVSTSIMASAAWTMRPAGLPVEQAIDMVNTLQPLAGRFATTLFVAGIVAAAVSSLFPNYVLGPWLVCDFLNRPRTMDHKSVRGAVAVVASLAFVVPVFGGRPVIIMIMSQAISTVIMPLLIVLLLVMLNRPSLVGARGRSRALNVGLIVTLIFAMLVSYSGAVGLWHQLRELLAGPVT